MSIVEMLCKNATKRLGLKPVYLSLCARTMKCTMYVIIVVIITASFALIYCYNIDA